MTMYAIVCSDSTALSWPDALAKLADKYEMKWPGQVRVILYKTPASNDPVGVGESPGTGLGSSIEQLSLHKPRYTCFLAHHSECSRKFVQEVNRLCRTIVPHHTYVDTIWGILTGYCEQDVLLALKYAPLFVRRVLANFPISLDMFHAGLWYSEREQGVSYRKPFGSEHPTRETCPGDTTELIVQEIGKERRSADKNNPVDVGVDMIVSSGHATEKDWRIAYTFKGGSLQCSEGQLFGVTVDGRRIDVSHASNPKVLSAAGNCLMGHISDQNCMALGWMHSGGVAQMVGYVEPTWFGYGGWGVNKYFLGNPGTMTLAESFFANQQSLLHELSSKYAAHLGAKLKNHREIYELCFDTLDTGQDGVSRECSGLVYDRDNVVLYGDPAWQARMEAKPEVEHYQCFLDKIPPESSSSTDDVWCSWTFAVKVLRSGSWDSPEPDDKNTFPGRPPLFIFPHRMRDPVLLQGKAVVTELFILLPLSGGCSPGQQHSVVFKSRI